MQSGTEDSFIVFSRTRNAKLCEGCGIEMVRVRKGRITCEDLVSEVSGVIV